MAIYRQRPVLFGILIALIGLPVVIVILSYNPSIGNFLSRNKVWGLLAVYTATIFPSLVLNFRPRHWSVAFWGLVTFLFLLHMACLIAFIRYVRPLAGIDYILFGPIECLIIALLLTRGMSFFSKLHPGHDGKWTIL